VHLFEQWRCYISFEFMLSGISILLFNSCKYEVATVQMFPVQGMQMHGLGGLWLISRFNYCNRLRSFPAIAVKNIQVWSLFA